MDTTAPDSTFRARRLLLRAAIFITVLSGASVCIAKEGLSALVGSEVPVAGAAEITTHRLRSDYQPGEQALHVLLPSRVEAGRRYPVLYVLPVYAGPVAAKAGIEEVRRLGLHDRFGFICVAPAFEKIPWYADHPSDLLARQEGHLLHAVLPYVEQNYPVLPGAGGRLLVGFSKSGWGAFSLLLRHPGVFGAAASWDAPLMMAEPGRWGTDRVWITGENFDCYCVTALLHERAPQLRAQPARLVLLGHGIFQDDIALHALMTGLGIPHTWQHEPQRPHKWNGGWLEPAVTALMALETTAPGGMR